MAITRLRGQLADLLGGPKLKLPPGIAPDPERGEVDPDGAPGIVLAEDVARNPARARARLEVALELRRGVRDIGDTLDRDIEALQTAVGKP
jgi:hypothetical protein